MEARELHEVLTKQFKAVMSKIEEGKRNEAPVEYNCFQLVMLGLSLRLCRIARLTNWECGL